MNVNTLLDGVISRPPWVTPTAMPANVRAVASVARNAFTRSTVTSSPLMSPITTPARIAMGNAHHTPKWTAAYAPSTSLRTKIDPSERSKLPAMIVRVTAQAAMPMVAFWKRRLRRFCEVRKTGDAIEK
jgi:hypothetical protein